jgi:hypothetical protein
LSVVDLHRLFKLDAPRDAVFKVLNALHHLGDKPPYVTRFPTRRVVEVGAAAPRVVEVKRPVRPGRGVNSIIIEGVFILVVGARGTANTEPLGSTWRPSVAPRASAGLESASHRGFFRL